MNYSPNWLRRTFVLLCALTIAIPPDAVAQDPQQHPDDTNTALAQKYSEQSNERAGGAEVDNPAARLEWERHVMSGFDAAARDFYLSQVGQQRSANPDLAPNAPSQSLVNNTSSLAFGGANSAPVSGKPTWINIGPTRADYEENGSFSDKVMDSGRARAILPHPTDANTVYLLTSGGGLWKTTDFLSTPPHWIPLTDTLPTTSGGWAAFGRDPNTIYLGLGDAYDITLPGGVMTKTTDGGATWASTVALGSSLSIRDVKVDTSTAQDIVLVASDTGIWRSIDNGTSYSQVVAGGVVGWSLVRTSAGWLASVQPCTGTKLQCGQASILLLSTDLGATWAPVTNTGNVFTNVGRTTLGIGAVGDSVVYALSGNLGDTAQGNVFRSADGGQNWTAMGVNSTKIPTNPNGDQPNMDVLHGQAWYNQMILVDPTDTNRDTLYIGGNLSSTKSTDGGNSWTVISNWLYRQFPTLAYVHADFHSAAFSTAGGKNTIFFGSDGGIFTSTNDGATFDNTRNENLTTHLFYSIASTPVFPDVVYGGLQDNGTRVKVPGSTTYNQTIGGDGVGAGWSQANANTGVGSSQGNPRRNLTNQPPDSTWDWERLGISNTNFLQPVAFPRATADPSGKIFFVASGTQLIKFINGGTAGSIIYSSSAAGVRSSPHNVAISPYDINRVAFGASGGRVGITLTGGPTANFAIFNLINLVPGFQGFIYSVTWTDNNTLFVTAAAQIPGSVHVVKGTLSGGTWNFAASESGLPGVSVQKIVADPTDPTNQTLFAATDIGVYRSTDAGASWSQYGAGLPAVRVSDIYVAPNGSYVRIATYGRGIWELPGLTFVSASLAGDGSGADSDGILDNGENGHVVITLRNDGGTQLAHITAAVSANSPVLTFPHGNSVIFPNVDPGGQTTAVIPVALNGAATLQQIDFNVAFGDPALNLPTPMTVQRSFRVNYDEAKGAFDDVEAAHSAWTVAGDPAVIPDIFQWGRREITASQHLWANIDSDGISDESLVSPVMHVGNGPFTFSFDHRFVLETGFDGGVIEISTDNGASWTDIGTSATPTYNRTLAAGGNPLSGRNAYSGRITSFPNFTTVNVNLGTTYANRDVRVRFRVGTDENTGAMGWELDNFVFNGITNNPFIVNVANAAQNITGNIDVKLSGYGFNPVTKRFSQTVTLTNHTGNAVTGPISFVLDNLSGNASVVTPTGVTAATSPAGSPYVNLNIGAANVMASGQVANVVIQFNNPTKAAITYTPRVLAGSGPR